MLRWLWCLIVGFGCDCGCAHSWEVFEKFHVDDAAGRFKAVDYHLRCKNCGDMKSTRL